MVPAFHFNSNIKHKPPSIDPVDLFPCLSIFISSVFTFTLRIPKGLKKISLYVLTLKHAQGPSGGNLNKITPDSTIHIRILIRFNSDGNGADDLPHHQ